LARADKASTRSDVVGHQGAQVDIAQRRAIAVNGWLGVVVRGCCVAGAWVAAADDTGVLWLPLLIFGLVITSLVIVPPGQTSVVQFFGRYIGSVIQPGFWWVAALTVRRRVSVRVSNFETNRLKVNDADGSPVEGTSLRGSTDLVVADLAREVAQRVTIAGVEIIEVRISHLAYAQEIAQAMLRRQQASAVVAARSRIVEGAVGMVSNLMVVLCGDQPPTPVVNTGSLYT
jgi:SPFH domain/Band 7 family protein